MNHVEHADPLRPGRGGRGYRTPGGFKTVELNAAGWSALVGAGAAAGTAASLATRAPLVGSILVAAVGSWAALLAADHRRWRNSSVSVSRGELTAADYQVAVESLRAQGIAASYTEILIDDETGETRGAIECRQKDLDAVERVLDNFESSRG